MVADPINLTLTGALVSANLLLQRTVSNTLVVFFIFVIAALLIFVFWNRYKKKQ